MSSRKRRRSGTSSRWLFALLGLGLVFVILILLAPMLVMSWVRGYLQQDGFRGRMEQFFGTQLQGSVTLAPLRWTGDEVTTQDATVTTASGWKAQLSSMRLALDWNAFRQGKWRVIGAGMDALDVDFVGALNPAPEASTPITTNNSGRGSAIPSWLRFYLPNQIEIDGVRVDELTFRHGPWKLTDSKLRLGAWQQGENSVQTIAEGGIIETPIQLPVQLVPMKFNLVRATSRLSRDDFHLTAATFHWLGDSEINVNGHIRPIEGTWNMNTQLLAIPLSEVLSEDWKLRLTGQIQADLDISGSRTQTPKVKGQVQLQKGVLTALPILDKLADYTGVARFKRLILDIASADVNGSGQTREFEKIIIQSNGLLRIEGRLRIDNNQLDGSFMVGVTPETLRWIPGAKAHVFTTTNPSGQPGLLWTPLRITGTLDAPREDLTDRLIGGAGKALLNAPAEILGKVGETLLKPVLGDDLAKKPTEVLKAATETLTKPGEAAKKIQEVPSKAVETGIDLLKGVGGGLFGK